MHPKSCWIPAFKQHKGNIFAFRINFQTKNLTAKLTLALACSKSRNVTSKLLQLQKDILKSVKGNSFFQCNRFRWCFTGSSVADRFPPGTLTDIVPFTIFQRVLFEHGWSAAVSLRGRVFLVMWPVWGLWCLQQFQGGGTLSVHKSASYWRTTLQSK